jgi:multidrug efflux pump subunit AcrB
MIISMHEDTSSFNVTGKVARFFMANRALSLLLLLGMLGFGLLSFVLTPKQYNPEIVRPAFALSLMYQGATPDEVVDHVVYELVEKISAVPGVDEIITEVHDGAQIGTTVLFEVGYDKTKAKVDLISQLNQHSYLAQGFITQPQVMEINPETIPVLQVVFSSASLSVAEVRAKVNDISHELTSIREMSDASVVGGYTPGLIIAVDPLRLTDAGVTVGDLMNALQQGESRMVTRGYENETHTIGVVFTGVASSPADVGALVVAPGVRVRDVATVYEGATPSRSYTLYDTKESDPTEVVMLAVSKVEGSSAPEVTRAVREKIDALFKEDAYKDLTYTVVSDDGATANGEIVKLTHELITSIVIVAIILFLFLSLRSATVVLIAIPTTLLTVFGIGYLFDQTINRITLFALILSLGILVDASIVVVENMYVHIKRGGRGTTAAMRESILAHSVNKIGIGLFFSTIASVVVFLPVNYISGMMGPYMGPIAFFVPVVLLVSFFVAITIVPFVASSLLSADEKHTRLSGFIDARVQRFIEKYKQVLGRIVTTRRLQRKILLGVLGAFLFVLIFPLVGLEHFQMLPRADRNQFYVYIDAPVDSALGETKRIADTVSTLITEDAEVTSVQQFVGVPPIVDFNGMFKGAQYRGQKYQATFRVNLQPEEERDRSSTDIVTDIRHALAKSNPEIAPMVRFIEEPPGPPVRSTLVAQITASDDAHAEAFAAALFPLIAHTEGVVDPYITAGAPVGDIVYSFNREKAALLGVSEFEVMSTLALYNGDIPVTEYRGNKSAEFSPVLLTLPRTHIDEPTDSNELMVHTGQGTLTPLMSVVDTSYKAKASTIRLERSQKLTYIMGELETRPIIYVTIDIMRALIRGDLEGYTVTDWSLTALTLADSEGEEVTLTWGGEWDITLKNFRDLGLAMVVAFALVYASLVVQYRSFKKSVFVMVTVPLSLIGILTGFLFLDQFFGIYLTATALIGFIALIGIVANNAIIFSGYLNQRLADGVPLHGALVESGGERFRPIMLTSLTNVLGTMTIVSDPVWSGLAWAIIFGLSLSASLTLVVYPTLLAYFAEGKSA